MDGALKRFRVMAWVVGVFLIILVFVGIPLQIFAHNESVVSIVGPIHGFLYIVYLIFAFDLAVRARWPFVRTVLVLLAGTVPVMSFVAERKATGWIRQRTDAAVPART
jgi:integral membrane protein